MIVGFPGETDADFEETLSLTRAVRFHSMFSFKYSPRPQTLAGQRYVDDVPEPEKTRRIVALQQAAEEIQSGLLTAMVGKTHDVLVDGLSRRRPTNGRPHRRQHHRQLRLAGGDVVGRPTSLGRIVRASGSTEAGPNARQGGAMQIEMTIKGLMIDPVTNTPIIVLRDKDGEARPPDLGRRVRGQCHRRADREHAPRRVR